MFIVSRNWQLALKKGITECIATPVWLQWTNHSGDNVYSVWIWLQPGWNTFWRMQVLSSRFHPRSPLYQGVYTFTEETRMNMYQDTFGFHKKANSSWQWQGMEGSIWTAFRFCCTLHHSVILPAVLNCQDKGGPLERYIILGWDIVIS